MSGIQEHPDPDDRGASRLAERLERLYAAAPSVPAHIDEAILARASQKLNAYRRFRTLLRWTAGAAAAAAILLIALRLANVLPSGKTPMVARFEAPSSPVTILDAYRLARQLESGQAPDKRWDADGNGAVDGRDVDVIARSAVRISGGPVQ